MGDIQDFNSSALFDIYDKPPNSNEEKKVGKLADKYGFFYDDLKDYGDLSKITEIEVERTKKWLKMFKNWERYFPSQKLTKRIYKGIPEHVRGEAWARLLDVYQEKLNNQNVYKKLLIWARSHSKEFKQIDLDVNRTFRNNAMFSQRYGPKQQSLFHILVAYSEYNREIGYCQGMNQIAALLLMYLNEEEAFWALSQLMTDKRHAMHGFYAPGFPKLHRYESHLENIMNHLLPKVKGHFDKLGIPPGLYCIKWFLQCFIDRTPFHLTLRLWDVFLLEGDKILIAMSYTILKLFRRELIRMDMERVMKFLNMDTVEKGIFDSIGDDKIISFLRQNILQLHRAKLLYPKPLPLKEQPFKQLGFTVPNKQIQSKEQISPSPSSLPRKPEDNSPMSYTERKIADKKQLMKPEPLINTILTEDDWVLVPRNRDDEEAPTSSHAIAPKPTNQVEMPNLPISVTANQMRYGPDLQLFSDAGEPIETSNDIYSGAGGIVVIDRGRYKFNKIAPDKSETVTTAFENTSRNEVISDKYNHSPFPYLAALGPVPEPFTGQPSSRRRELTSVLNGTSYYPRRDSRANNNNNFPTEVDAAARQVLPQQIYLDAEPNHLTLTTNNLRSLNGTDHQHYLPSSPQRKYAYFKLLAHRKRQVTSPRGKPTPLSTPALIEGVDAAAIPIPTWYSRNYNNNYAVGPGFVNLRTGYEALKYLPQQNNGQQNLRAFDDHRLQESPKADTVALNELPKQRFKSSTKFRNFSTPRTIISPPIPTACGSENLIRNCHNGNGHQDQNFYKQTPVLYCESEEFTSPQDMVKNRNPSRNTIELATENFNDLDNGPRYAPRYPGANDISFNFTPYIVKYHEESHPPPSLPTHLN